jgi:hypothetical protein
MSAEKINDPFFETVTRLNREALVVRSFAGMKRVVQGRKNHAKIALHWARRGDWRSLAMHLDRGGIIDKDVRAFLIDVLYQKVPRPNNRAQTQEKGAEGFYRATCVSTEMMGDGKGGGHR